MKLGLKLSISILSISALLALSGCQSSTDIASAVQSKLATANPTWSGTTWVTNAAQDQDNGEHLAKQVFTNTSSSATTATLTTYSLTSNPAKLTINADGTFTITLSTINDSTNYGKTFVDDNYYWSTASGYFNAPSLVTTGSTYTTYVYSTTYTGQSAYFYNTTYGQEGYPFPTVGTDCTIGTTASAAGTPYAGYYPVTYTTTPKLAGLTTQVTTYSGTWATHAPLSGIVSGQDVVLTFTAGTTVKYYFNSSTGAVVNTVTSNATITNANFQLGVDNSSVTIGTNPDTKKSGYYINGLSVGNNNNNNGYILYQQ
jgi:hypothetical protein